MKKIARRRFTDWAEAEDFLKELKTEAGPTPYKNRIAAGAAILLYTGIRFSELKCLTWGEALMIARGEAIGNGNGISLAGNLVFESYLTSCFEDCKDGETDAEFKTKTTGLIVPNNNPFFNRNLTTEFYEDINTGTLRRTFARRSFNLGGANYEVLLTLQKYFNHPNITRTVEMIDVEKPQLIKPMRIFV